MCVCVCVGGGGGGGFLKKITEELNEQKGKQEENRQERNETHIGTNTTSQQNVLFLRRKKKAHLR